MEDVFEEIVRLQSKGEHFAIATIISTSGSVPRQEGTKMVVRQDGSTYGTIGGGILEAKVGEIAKRAIEKRKTEMFSFDLSNKAEEGMMCGGKVSVYIEPILPKSIVCIFGGGHIALSLARISKMVGFKVIVIDDREEYANPERFPDADETIADEYTIALPKLKINQLSYIVIVTRGHKFDQTVLEWAITTNAKYIGMIGSRHKIKKIFDNLVAKGISRKDMDRVHSPIGLDIKAETPEEIAVSIMAELIKERHTNSKK